MGLGCGQQGSVTFQAGGSEPPGNRGHLGGGGGGAGADTGGGNVIGESGEPQSGKGGTEVGEGGDGVAGGLAAEQGDLIVETPCGARSSSVWNI